MDDLTFYNSFTNIRANTGILGYGVRFNDNTGAVDDNGQTLFLNCNFSAGAGAVKRIVVAATRHRILFARCGFQSGSSSAYVVDLSYTNNTTILNCDFELYSTVPTGGAFLHIASNGVNVIGCNFSNSVAARPLDVVKIDGGFYGNTFVGNTTEYTPAGSYFYNSSAAAVFINNYVAGGGSTFGSSVGANVVELHGGITGAKIPYLSSAAASPPALTANGQLCEWRDTTNNKSYLVAYINAAQVMVELS